MVAIAGPPIADPQRLHHQQRSVELDRAADRVLQAEAPAGPPRRDHPVQDVVALRARGVVDAGHAQRMDLGQGAHARCDAARTSRVTILAVTFRWAAVTLAGLAVPATAVADDGARAAADDLFGLEPTPEPADVDLPCQRPRDPWCVLDAGARPDPAPGELRERLTRVDLEVLGARGQGHDGAVGYAVGAARDDGGVALAGASSLEHRWLIDGLPAESLISGGAGLGIPIRFLDSIEVITGGSPASRRLSTGATIDAQLRDGDVTTVEAWARAGAAAPRRVPAPFAYDPLTLEADDHRGAAVGLVLAAPWHGGWFDRQWGLLGYEGNLRTDGATRVAAIILDADGDGAADVVTERHLPGVASAHAAVARLGVGHGRHDLELTALVVAVIDPRLSADGVVEAASQRRRDLAGLGLAQWRSRWPDTTVAIDLGWFTSQHRERGWTDGAADQVQIGTAYVPLPADVPDDDVFATACATGLCPVPEGYYVRGGAGLLQQVDGDRPVVTGELVRHVRAGGVHRVAAGGSAEDARLVFTRSLSGGALERRLAEDIVLTSRFVALDEGGSDDCGELGPCRYLDRLANTYRTRTLAGWLEDTWRPTPDVTAQGGLRWESMEVANDVRFRDQLAPRIAIAVDPGARGRSRYFVAWTRSYPVVPAGVGLDVSGGPQIYTHLDSSVGERDSLDDGARLPVDPALQPAPVDELVLGAERVIQDAVQVGAAWRSRWMMRGIDDVGGVLVNPGSGLDADGGRLTRIAHDAVAWLATPPGGALQLRVAYMHSRQRGAWAGPYDPAQGAVLWTSDFAGEANASGRLPQDLPHRLDVRAVARRPWAGGQLAVGARMVVSSGRPYSALGGDQRTLLIRRGEAGRLAPLGSATLTANLIRGGWTFGLDLINPFQVRTATAVDERYTFDDAGAIHGGEASDLLWAKRDDAGASLRRSPNWGRATRFQAPAFVQLSAMWAW